MVIVVPAFTEGKDRDPEAILGIVACTKSLRPPHVCSRVHEPREVETDDGPQKNAPHYNWPPAQKEEEQGIIETRFDVVGLQLEGAPVSVRRFFQIAAIAEAGVKATDCIPEATAP